MTGSRPSQVRLDGLIDRHGRDPAQLLQILREVEDEFGFVPAEALTRIAAAVALPRARVEGVAGFYAFLHMRPAGRYRVLFSDNVTDRLQGSVELFEHFCRKLWLERGRVSEDGLVSADLTSCTGMCDQGPALLVNGWAVPALTTGRLDTIVDLIRAQVPLRDWPQELFAVEDNVRRTDTLLCHAIRPGDAIRAVLERDRGAEGASLGEVERSGLRGRGGAGFPTAAKWQACRDAPGPQRYVVGNADEGEPGTFKDRVLLTRHADLVIEGMTVCARVVGAAHGLLYLRGEYRHLQAALLQTIERRRATGLLGHAILGQPGFDFDLELHLGAGAYICGEESALIESLEGRRGVPRNRPPYPVTHGYRQLPTAVNNVETFCAAAMVVVGGGDGYRRLGTPESAGTKLLAVAGDCARPGVYEYPFGVSVRTVLDDCGAVDAQAVQVSGPSGTCLDEAEFGRRIGFEDVPTAGSLMVFDRRRDMFEVARNFVHFFARESCGFCTPCRVGTALLKRGMDKLHAGHGSQHDLNEMIDIAQALQAASHCGLGHTAAHPLLDTLSKFHPSYERRLSTLAYAPAFDLDGALAAARQMTGRDDAGAHLRPATNEGALA